MSNRRADGLALVGLAAATIVVCWPLVSRPLTLLPEGAIDEYPLWARSRFILLHYGQFPFRDPYGAAGYPNYVNPADVTLSPRFLLMLLGPWAGVKADFVLCVFLAASGTYVLLRRQFGLAVPGALVAAAIFAFSGYFLYRWMQGWLILCRQAVLPWVLYFWWRSRQDRRFLIVLGPVMASLVLDGRYALALVAWFMMFWMLLRLDRTGGGTMRDRLTVGQWVGFLGVLGWAVLLAAPKLVPMMPILWGHFMLGGRAPARSGEQVVMWGSVLLALAVAPMTAGLKRRVCAVAATIGVVLVPVVLFALWCPVYDMPLMVRLGALAEGVAQRVFFFHYLPWGAHLEPFTTSPSPVGLLGALLAGLAVYQWPGRLWRLALVTALFLAFDVGNAAPLNLQASWRAMPFLSLPNNAVEYLAIYMVFGMAVLAGHGAMAPATWWRGRVGRAVPWVLAVASVTHFAVVARPLYASTVTDPLPEFGPFGDDYHIVADCDLRPPASVALVYRNVGWLPAEKGFLGLEARGVQVRSFRPGGSVNPRYRGEVYFLSPDSPNTAHLLKFTPLEIIVQVEVAEPGVLCINQRHDENWRVSAGRLTRDAGPLAVALSRTGEYEVRLRYVAGLFWWGVAVGAVSLVAGVVLILRSRSG